MHRGRGGRGEGVWHVRRAALRTGPAPRRGRGPLFQESMTPLPNPLDLKMISPPSIFSNFKVCLKKISSLICHVVHFKKICPTFWVDFLHYVEVHMEFFYWSRESFKC
ncbi:hypothetical protein O6H91_21G053500 [Diphasiastrum complanatum]|uniref:Uncharacterized protein n=1 Tax=Diphasiastrum complanatum TaxID=34168 RepID=A0ACC2ALS2_DIPCM|nr:hypothetical protein O6H91_21G053500 [Diphasiastrum complanatum]